MRMLLLSLVFCLMLVPISQTHADEADLTPTQKLLATKDSAIKRIGPEVSLGTSFLEGDLGFTRTGRMSYSAGVILDIGRGRTVFETGFLYRQLGDSGSVGEETANFNLGYFALPLGVKHSFSDVDPFFVRASLVPSLAVVKHVTISNNNNRASETYRVRMKDFDVQATAGIGKTFSLTTDTTLQVALNYLRGLTSISSEYEIYNSAFLVTASLYLEK